MFQISGKLLVLLFILLSLNLYCEDSLAPTHTVQVKNPRYGSGKAYFYQSYLYDPHYGIFRPQLFQRLKQKERVLTSGIGGFLESRLIYLNGTVYGENELFRFEYSFKRGVMRTVEAIPQDGVLLNFESEEPIKVEGRVIGLDNGNLYTVEGGQRVYHLISNCLTYDISPDGKELLILSGSYYNDYSTLFRYIMHGERAEISKVDEGMISRPLYGSDDLITYIKDKRAWSYNLIEQQGQALPFKADYCRLTSAGRDYYYRSEGTLYLFESDKGESKTLFTGVNSNFVLSQDGTKILKEQDGKLYLDDLLVSTNFDSYSFYGDKILLLRTEYRDLITGETVHVEKSSGLLYLEMIDLEGHPENVILLTSNREGYRFWQELIPNSFAISKRGDSIVFTHKNVVYGELEELDIKKFLKGPVKPALKGE